MSHVRVVCANAKCVRQLVAVALECASGNGTHQLPQVNLDFLHLQWSIQEHGNMLSIHGIIITNLFQCNNHLKLRRKKQKARINATKIHILDLTKSFGFGLESKSVAGFGVNPKPNPSIESYSGSDRIQKSNTRTPNPLKKTALTLRSNQKY